MDDSFQDLEAELKALRPRRPGAGLLENIRQDLVAPADEFTSAPRPRYATATNLASWKWLGWRTAGLAAGTAAIAVLAVIAFQQRVPQVTAPAAPLVATQPVIPRPPANLVRDEGYQPVAATNVLYDLQDEGLVTTEDDSAARRVRYRYLDTYTWKNPKTNASLKWSVPRDEIRLVAATLN